MHTVGRQDVRTPGRDIHTEGTDIHGGTYTGGDIDTVEHGGRYTRGTCRQKGHTQGRTNIC